MQLEQVEVEVVGDAPRLFRLLVDEDADDPGAYRKLVDDRLRLFRRDPPVGPAEVKADHVGAPLDRGLRALEVADTADLDPDHWFSSLSCDAGSADRMRSSPTRIASAPASRMRRASSGPWIPLSATSTTSGGTSLRRRSVRPRSTSNVRRSRWLTPIARAPAS